MRLISSLFRIPLVRWAKLLAGLACVGIGIAFTKQANLGLGPWDVLGDGLAQLTGIQLGTASIIVGALVLLLWIPIQEKPGVGTFMNILLIGAFTNIALAVVQSANGVLRLADTGIASRRSRQCFISRKPTRGWPARRFNAGLG